MNGHSTHSSHSSKIISASILHRHGSRGPGESELTPWQADSPVKLQWAPSDLENITTIGHKQCLALGEWFSAYISQHGINDDSPSIFWRCSKSGRAKESGLDFIRGFNSSREEAISEKPVPYEENADNYFRPWKVVPEFGDTIKKRMANDTNWAEKAQENIELLKKVFTKADAESILTKPTKTLWSTTYLYCARECELFWPSKEGYRGVLDSLLDENEWDGITKLACWVWEERFVRSGYVIPMGGKLLREILTQSQNPTYSVNIYSGHDYTILAVLSLLGVIPKIQSPASFGCYILFELWDGPPPPYPTSSELFHHSGDGILSSLQTLTGTSTSTSKEKSSTVLAAEGSILRVIFNAEPFSHNDDGDKLTVQYDNQKIVGEYSMSDVQALIDVIDIHFDITSTHPSSAPQDLHQGLPLVSSTLNGSKPEDILRPMGSTVSALSEIDELQMASNFLS